MNNEQQDIRGQNVHFD